MNEELGATAVWGTQQLNLYPNARSTTACSPCGTARGPGVDRCGDVFKHGNHAGTSKHGGVLLIAATITAPSRQLCRTSPITNSSVRWFCRCCIRRRTGIPRSRRARLRDESLPGCHVGMKAVTDTVESTASVIVDPDRIKPIIPEDFPLPEGGVNIRLAAHAA